MSLWWEFEGNALIINPSEIPLTSHCGEALFEVGDDVVDMLCADRQAARCLRDACLGKLLIGQLGVRRRCRMNHQRLDIRDICKQRENLQMINKCMCFLLTALDLKGKDAAAAVREILSYSA